MFHQPRIRHHSTGQKMGPITRLIAPSQLGQISKPFVLLDYFELPAGSGASGGFGWHPHSGIATISLLMEGEGWAEETDLHRHPLHTDDVEWVMTGNGIWHRGGMSGSGKQMGVQIWMALPPELENQPASTRYVPAAAVPRSGAARVIIGRHGDVTGPVGNPDAMTCLDVRLRKGESWEFLPPAAQTVMMLVVYKGRVDMGRQVRTAEIVLLEASDTTLRVEAEDDDTRFVVGASVPHPHDLCLGQYSVHTNETALAKGEAMIRHLGTQIG